ncbi:DUF2637 domain-containing protein [Kitasatospora sp. NPDC056789]|uniref:DUF2637 domain-containing protein n=1 Tax=Kitasatospora sp. NPDC056789 TaxID=3345945 RepID=UPI0036766EA5
MTDGLTADEALRALAALEAAFKDDDEALTALAASGPGERPLPALVAAYGEHAMDTLMALAFGLRATMSDEEIAEISDAVSSNIGAHLVPFGLDGAAMFCSVLAVREASHGDAALGSRLLVWLFAGASAWFNWVHAPRGLTHAGAPQFFSGMSLSAAILFDRALKQTRRAALREQGLVPRPLPQIRIVRWLRAPRETYAAWSLMLLENVRSLDEAVEEVRDDKRERADEKQRRKLAGRRERAEIRAINRSHSAWRRGGGTARRLGSGAEPATAAATDRPGVERVSTERVSTERVPAERVGAERPEVERPAGPREVEPAEGTVVQPGLPARPERRTIDLTLEEDTVTLPRLDEMERKLKDLEQQFG